MNRSSYYSEIIFKNLDGSQGFSYEIKERQSTKAVEAAMLGEAPTFFVSPTRGDLWPLGTLLNSSNIPAPEEREMHQDSGCLYHRTAVTRRALFSILCRGSGVYPSLSFSQRCRHAHRAS